MFKETTKSYCSKSIVSVKLSTSVSPPVFMISKVYKPSPIVVIELSALLKSVSSSKNQVKVESLIAVFGKAIVVSFVSQR